MNRNYKVTNENISKGILLIIPYIFKNLFSWINKQLRFSISFKTTAINTAILTIILFFTSSLMLGALYNLLSWQDERDILKISSFAAESLKNNNNHINETLLKNYSISESAEISIFDKNKEIVFFSLNNKNPAVFQKSIDSVKIEGSHQKSFIYINRKIAYSDNLYYLQVVKHTNGHIGIMGAASAILFIFDGLIIILSGFVISKTTKKMLSPIVKMTATAKSISINALNTRLDVVESQDELKELAETFNDMLFRLELSYEQQNQFVSDASHELRTPIAVIQGYINMLNRWGKNDRDVLEEAIAAIKSESDNMKDLVENLLFLARTDKNTQKMETEPFSFKELIDEILRETRMIDKKHIFICEKNDSFVFKGDRSYIKQALRIFIDNGIKYTPENGLIKINSSSYSDRLLVTIQDNGIGISKEDLPHIFDRFYRCDKSRKREGGGTGLGLSIAKWIITKHNGSIKVDSTVNVGTKIFITLPVRS